MPPNLFVLGGMSLVGRISLPDGDELGHCSSRADGVLRYVLRGYVGGRSKVTFI